MNAHAIAGDNGAADLDWSRADDFFARLKVRTIAAMLIQPGDCVVDVGCGTGEEVLAMSLAAHDVSATGFDLSERSIAEARRRHVSRQVESFLLMLTHFPSETPASTGAVPSARCNT